MPLTTMEAISVIKTLIWNCISCTEAKEDSVQHAVVVHSLAIDNINCNNCRPPASNHHIQMEQINDNESL